MLPLKFKKTSKVLHVAVLAHFAVTFTVMPTMVADVGILKPYPLENNRSVFALLPKFEVDTFVLSIF